MCCFSQPVRHVSKTRIFARPLDGGRQLLVYSMSLDADADLAMVLPIPVPPSSAEDAVRFVDMSSCPTFFDKVESLFPAPVTFGKAARGGAFIEPQPAPLVVHDVGDFEASFVPTRADFDRLDVRFRLPGDVWDALPMYADWGFCVFKLRAKPSSIERSRGPLDRVLGWLGGAGSPPPPKRRDFHPMAFEFPRRDPTRLFFPTVHVHDGAVHAKAWFDHSLFCQVRPDLEAVASIHHGTTWERSFSAPSAMPDAVRWLDPDAHVYRQTIAGTHPNRDVHVQLSG
jgi:hypothetical protein